MQLTLLIVDDDRALVAILRRAFPAYRTVFATDGETALFQLKAETPDIVLLDLMLAGAVDGGVLLRQIRKISNVPIIVCSARQEQVDRVLALTNGADDFIGKPFELDDMEARIDAVARRSRREPIPPLPGDVGDQIIAAARLTVTEYRVLAGLAAHADEVVTREELSSSIMGFTDKATKHLIDVHVCRLRAKLRRTPSVGLTIITARERGFVLKGLDPSKRIQQLS